MAQGSSNKATEHRVKHLRAQAKEARSVASRMQFTTARDTMLRLAQTFDRLADHIDDESDTAD
jgi:hypothetical protein